MKVYTKPLPQPFRLQIVEDDLKFVTQTLDNSWEQIKDTLEAPGFRKGMIPRSVAEKKIGQEKIYRSGLNVILDKGIRESGLNVYEVASTTVEWHTDKQPLVMSATCILKPQIITTSYNELKVDYKPMVVNEKEVDTTLERLAFGEAVEIDVNGPVAADNIAHVSFSQIDPKSKKVLATQKSYPARMNQNRFGFESTLEGRLAGVSYEVPITLPADYFNAPLRGREILVQVQIHRVIRLDVPAINDALAEKIGYESLVEMRASITKDLEKDKKKADSLTFLDAVLGAAIAKTEFTPLPDAMIKDELDLILQTTVDDTNTKNKTKLTTEQVLSHMGLTQDRWYTSQWMRGTRKIHLNMMLDNIVKTNALVVSTDECEAELAAIVPANIDKKTVNNEHLRAYLLRKKAQQYLVELVTKANTPVVVKSGEANG